MVTAGGFQGHSLPPSAPLQVPCTVMGRISCHVRPRCCDGGVQVTCRTQPRMAHGLLRQLSVKQSIGSIEAGEPSDKRRLLPERMGASWCSVLAACRPPHARTLVPNLLGGSLTAKGQCHNSQVVVVKRF